MAGLWRNWFFALILLLAPMLATAQASDGLPEIAFAQLPGEAQRTIALVRQGGPYPFAKDGAVFGNHERLLPRRQRGYYREFTVKMKGANGRGVRRVVVGGEPTVSRDLYYTDDHYASFKRIKE